MASPYILTNTDLQYTQAAAQSYQVYLAFLNPVSITTTWHDLSMDNQGNWLPPANLDAAYNHIQPYAPTANLGPNRIGFVGEPLFFDGGRSSQRFDLPVSSSSYSWTISGSYTTQYYANKSQVEIIWNAPGLYTVSLSVADRAGTRTTGTRQVMVYANRQTALPGVISVDGLSGSISNGGWQMQCTTVNSQITLYPPDALAVGQYQPIVMMIETQFEVTPGVWVNRTIGPNGLFNPGYPYIDPRIVFDGYVQNGTIHQDVDKDTLAFSCLGPQMILQEAKCHQLGYYNCAYSGSDRNGNPTGCKTSPVGNGYQIGGLMTADILHALLQYHCTIGQYHDIHIWNSSIPVTPSTNYALNTASYNLTYTTLTVNEGTIWENMGDLASNEFSQVYCEHDGSIRVGPMVNYRGPDYWGTPTLLGQTAAPFFVNLVQDLGYSVGSTLSTMTQNVPPLPAQPMPIIFVHPWAHQTNPPQFLKPFSEPNYQIQQTQANLVGPPILCVFSDTPIYDTSMTPPDTNALYPWIANNWPQDLAIYPISMDITENYTGRASLVKLIGTLYGHTTLWSSWYPRSAFSPTGNGTVSIVTTTLPASDWVVDQSHVLADVTTSQNANLLWNWWWEAARRQYFDHNTNYTASVVCGLFTGATLGDIMAITRQNNTLGTPFNNKLFYCQEISYALDLMQRTWQTTFTLTEVTSVHLPIMQAPPTGVPKG